MGMGGQRHASATEPPRERESRNTFTGGTAGVLTEIRTRHLPSRDLDRHRLARLVIDLLP
jgi:hypothetical protein